VIFWPRILERGTKALLFGCASAATLAVVLIFGFLAKEGLPLFGEVSLSNLLGARWAPISHKGAKFGLQPLLAGTLLVTFTATLLALPFGIGGAVYVAEFASPRERAWLKPLVELLAGIPSVVLGFFGLVVLGPLVKTLFGLPSGLTALTGAILLAFMAVPTILSVSEDALRAVPASYREASLALGATEWETTWRVIVPAARSGLVAALMLGVGRVVGETMAVMMCTGNAAVVTGSPLSSVRTMTATVAAEMGEVPFGSEHYRALFVVGLVLLTLTFGINLVARRFQERAGAGGRA